jgi:sugar O-acyltransferase (sialic acid O-acetyltransferase NeuD family)
MRKEAIIIGYSGHAYVMIEVLKTLGYDIVGYCEQEIKQVNPYNLEYFGEETASSNLSLLTSTSAFIGIGNNLIRSKVFNALKRHDVLMPSAIHPSSTISTLAKIDFATLVMPGVIVNALVNIGKGVICNTASVIEHECTLGDFVHIAPGAVLAGNITIGENSFIGANSVIKEGIKVGRNVTVGAGSVVLRNILDGEVVAGNPAKRLR